MRTPCFVEQNRRALEETAKLPGPPVARIIRIELLNSQLFVTVVKSDDGPEICWPIPSRYLDSLNLCRRFILRGTALLLRVPEIETLPLRRQRVAWLDLVQQLLDRGRAV